jgi:hypothetical protein
VQTQGSEPDLVVVGSTGPDASSGVIAQYARNQVDHVFTETGEIVPTVRFDNQLSKPG